MEHQYPQYVEAFRWKEKPFRRLLGPQARILEVGSHYGAFLQVAQEWGWHTEGLDPVKDTGGFARSKGFNVHESTLDDCGFLKSTSMACSSGIASIKLRTLIPR